MLRLLLLLRPLRRSAAVRVPVRGAGAASDADDRFSSRVSAGAASGACPPRTAGVAEEGVASAVGPDGARPSPEVP
ncbi:hypothetical protein AUQ48_03570 [Kocuria flava]|uniref:Uncharacterized protein n=1 Tax=Kocuria flava TaxID=446860 RepID=A0A2N4SZX7_9MICC|nr:hypothetical protein AUQ48_03570 [Kocuria flava]